MKLSDIAEIIAVIFLALLMLQFNNILSFVTGSSIPVAVVSSYSMDPVLHVGDIIVTVQAGDINIGDIVVYSRGNDYIVHRVIKTVNMDTYITKGDANSLPDSRPVTREQIKGKVYMVIPYMGSLSLIFNKSPILVIFYFLILISIIFLSDYLAEEKSKKNSSNHTENKT
ncbi:MAG: signal peptidase I [Thermoprotei archaeon]|nr:MAG: signal peptidase I [Thermoprotei archaeon]